jgi:phosphoesterase RecJ-like protein
MFKGVKNLIEKSNSIVVVSHPNPDGDAIGSAFATYLGMKKIGKNVKVVMQNYSDTFKFLPHIKEAVKTVEWDEYDLLICVDSSDINRLDISEEDRNKAKKRLMLDHHKKIIPYGDINCVDETLPAAAEMIYNFLKELNIEIDQEIAIYLYTGIMTDTGSFNYSSTKPSTLRIAAELVETGIDFSNICKKLNDTIKEEKLKLISKTIEKMETFFNGKLRYSYIDYDTIKELGIDEEDAEGMTNYLRMVDGTEVAVYVREKSNGTYKVSMRSGSRIDVSQIAIKFGGGGHARAAGYSIENGKLDEFKQKLIDIIEVML